jgi:UDP-N-acetyl-alpha-D-muramoyl-L-alanyl-L-glutamate epimerase
MNNINNQLKYEELRGKHDFFSYEKHSYKIEDERLKIDFYFNLADEYCFNPQIEILLDENLNTEHLSSDFLNNLIFHIGMVELISYWKAACPKKLIIKPFSLSLEQINWWKKLYFQGLGEFYYVNGIEDTMNDFMAIECLGRALPGKSILNLNEEYIVPVGGGKDSVVSLELLKAASKKITPLIMNPRGATTECVEAASLKNTIIINRYLDKGIMELNAKGFLNGHTPFSALLAFLTSLSAAMSGKKNIALSNESSANESTVLGSYVNHQYSKSIEFENDFRDYMHKYISADINYFSLLRPLSELQIVSLFSKYKQYHSVFKSCNVGSKENIWCGSCSKCTFTFTMLSAFLPLEEVIAIFGKNLFEDKNLILYLDQLCGFENTKPFECVGTTEEVNIALQKFINENLSNDNCLITHYKDNSSLTYNQKATEEFMHVFEAEHNINDSLLRLIKSKFE